MDLDFSFLSWGVISNFVLKGLVFSVGLTLISMLGGVVLGTCSRLCLVRKEVAIGISRGLCELAAVDPARDGDPVVLLAHPISAG